MLEIARKKVQSENCHQKVRDRLISALSLVNRYRGIAKAKAILQGEELKDFKRSLKSLGSIGINPVTIPRGWGIKHIRNLFDAYLDKITDEEAKERKEQCDRECIEEYIRDCKKQGKSWI